MFGRNEWIAVGLTLVGIWIAHLAGSDVGAWICGFAGLVILVVLFSKGAENEEPRNVLAPATLTDQIPQETGPEIRNCPWFS
jgi:hypothetical protein